MSDTHFNETLDKSKELHGNSRAGGDAPPEIQQRLVDILIEEAHKLNFNNRDTAYYLAIVKHESGFNPDAANSKSTASGAGQIEDGAAKKYGLDKTNRFDARSNIRAGLRYFADLKAQVISDFGNANGNYEPLIYFTYHFGQFSTHHRHPDPKNPSNIIVEGPFTINELMNESPHKGRYNEAVTVLQDAARLEAILNAEHGLHIQLTDVLGKSMAGRKVIVVQPKPAQPDAPKKAPTSAAVTPDAKSPVTPVANTQPAAVQPAAAQSATAQPPVTVPPTTASPTTTPPATPQSGDSVQGNVTTDQSTKAQADGATGAAAPALASQPDPTQTPAPDQNAAPIASTSTGTGTGSCGTPAATNGDGQTDAKDGPKVCLAQGWTWTATEHTTDADGKLPEVVTDSQQPIYVLIPRPEYAAYNDAVAKQLICESGNQHDVVPKDNVPIATCMTKGAQEKTDGGGDQSDQSQGQGGDANSDKKPDSTTQGADATGGKDPTQPSPPATPASTTAAAKPQAPPPAATSPTPAAVAKPAAAQQATKPAATATAQSAQTTAAKSTASASTQQGAPEKAPRLSALEILEIVDKTLSLPNLLLTTFSYIKEFHTKPKLPDKPLDSKTATEKGPPRTQVIGSSLNNKDVKAPEAKADTTTAKKTVEKKVEATGDAPWMAFAQDEAGKTIQTKRTPSPKSDPDWQAAHKKREEAKQAKAQAQSDLKKEVSRKKPPPDPSKIKALQTEVATQQKNYDDANGDMKAAEKKCYTSGGYNNDAVVEYLKTTLGDTDMARDISTPWCASFVNWCLQKAGYKGTNNAAAESYENWGKKITEPVNGAITVVTRSKNPVQYHVGFYTGIQKKNVQIGTEEVEEKDKHGKIVKVVHKKYKTVDYVTLLSGNFSSTVREYADWTVDPADDEKNHWVSYHWPTDAEKLDKASS